jgi:hypothetical protein
MKSLLSYCLFILISLLIGVQSNAQTSFNRQLDIGEIIPLKSDGLVRVYFNTPQGFSPSEIGQLGKSIRIREEVMGAGKSQEYVIPKSSIKVKAVDAAETVSVQNSVTERNIIIAYLDYSGSMQDTDLKQAFDALRKLVDVAYANGSPLYFGIFNTYVQSPYVLTSKSGEPIFKSLDDNTVKTFDNLREAFSRKNVNYDSQDTDLYGVIHYISTSLIGRINKLEQINGKKVVVLLSDGAHSIENDYYEKAIRSKEYNVRQNNLLDSLKSIEKETAFFPIAFGNPDYTFLQAVCNSTPNINDKVFKGDVTQLSVLLRNVINDARSKFYLEYEPQDKLFKGEKRVIKISATVGDLQFAERDNNKMYRYGSEMNIEDFHQDDDAVAVGFSLVIPLVAFFILFLIGLVFYPAVYRIYFKIKFIEVIKGNVQYSIPCPICFDPLLAGEKVVKKCLHITHLECWDQNHKCLYHDQGKCPKGKELVADVTDLLKNPFKIEELSNAILGALGGFLGGIISLFLIDRVRTIFQVSQDSEAYLISLPAFLFGFFITGSILFNARRNQLDTRNIFGIALASLIAGVGSSLAALVLSPVVLEYFNFRIVSGVLIWAPIGMIIGATLSYFGDMAIRNAVIAGLAGGSCGAVVNELMPVLIPEGYKGSSTIVANMAFGAILSMLIVVVVKRLEDCWLKVTSSNYNSDKPLYIGKWLKDGSVLVGATAKESQVGLYFDNSGKIADRHFKITDTRKGYTIENISNGFELFVSGRSVQQGISYPLRNNESIQVGNTQMLFIVKDKK